MGRFRFGLLVALLILTTAFPQYTNAARPASGLAALAGLQITASLDKAVYTFPDTIVVTIQGTNTTNSPMVLTFGGCQTSYLFDGAAAGQACLSVISEVTISPQSTHTWTMTFDAAPVGEHTIAGMIIGYGTAEPVPVVIQGHRLDLVYVAK